MYTVIPQEKIKETLLNTYDHFTGHVYLLYKTYVDMVVLGHNKKHDNVASFGGFAEVKENLLETIRREFREESRGTVLTEEKLIEILQNKSVMITRTLKGKQYYTLFCMADQLLDDMKTIQKNFQEKQKEPGLTDGEKENDNIVFIPIENIKQNIDKIELITDIDGKPQKIREINIPAYKCFFDQGYQLLKNL
jgi:hypothetical protein